MKTMLRPALFCLMILLSAGILQARDRHALKPHFRMRSHETARADSATGFDVIKYEITLTINDISRFISGNVLTTVLAEENLTALQYNLHNLNVSAILVNDAPATFTHTGGLINIALNIPVGQTFTTQVFYSGYPQLSPNLYQIGMIFSTNSVFTISDPDAGRYWWPCYDYPWDKAIVDLHITMRSDWKVAANGIRSGIVNNGDGSSTTHWIGSHPMTTYLVCITAGPYVEILQSAGGIPIHNFVLPNQYNNALVDFANQPAMINYFSSVFGAYPFEKYGNAVVSMSTYGAMEHQTMTTLGNFIITGTGAYELIIAHELAHQWYGNCVSFLTFKDVWLSEGFATYSEHLWVDKTQGWQASANYVGSSYHQYYLNWEAGAGAQTIYNPSFYNYFSPPSYEKAASVLHMLRLKIGEANFFQLLQQWVSTYHNGNAITSELQTMAEQISGMDLHQFFLQWIYSPGVPSLEYSLWQNPLSNSPTKIMAKTTSPTSTQFHLEVPFRISYNAGSDSLYVMATPSGHAGYYPHVFDPDAITITPNHNNWTLLRLINQQKPVLTECLPSNAAVLISWQSFLGDPSLSYNIFRRPGTAGAWVLLNPAPLNALSYTDSSAQNGTAYQYAVSAIDAQGYFTAKSTPMNATPVAFTFANSLLVVDETRDGNGANINPNDQMVDAFYTAALTPLVFDEWDCATQGLPPLDILGTYRVVLWHADDFSQNLLIDHQNTLGGYILGGGRVLLSGWKTASVLSDSFISRFTGGAQLIYDNSASLISARSDIYADLEVDPLKTAASWNGMLPQIYTFANVQNPLYTATMSATAAGNGQIAAFRYDIQPSGGRLVMFGFPLYFMQADGVRALLQSIIPHLDPALPNDDNFIPALSASLCVFPNPFNP
ncbi:MAG: M1 family aminopeptidase, partial [Candidatus Cloacimonadaceae bacterium]|nr:M1 family aminopeptidase [Candidatus Cloacimonadaceae bacterium]